MRGQYARTPENTITAPATRARKANAKLRQAIAAQQLLESLGCTVIWPPQPHEDIAAATIKR